MRWLLLALLCCGNAEPAAPPAEDAPELELPELDTDVALAQEDPEPSPEDALDLELEKYEHIFDLQEQQQDRLEDVREEIDSLTNYLSDKKRAQAEEAVVWCYGSTEQPPMTAYEGPSAPASFIGPDCPPPIEIEPVVPELVVPEPPTDTLGLMFDASLGMPRRRQ